MTYCKSEQELSYSHSVGYVSYLQPMTCS